MKKGKVLAIFAAVLVGVAVTGWGVSQLNHKSSSADSKGNQMEEVVEQQTEEQDTTEDKKEEEVVVAQKPVVKKQLSAKKVAVENTTKVEAPTKGEQPSNQEKPAVPNKPVSPNKPVTPEEPQKKLSYEGYTLKWQDEFNGNSLDTDNWNVEIHDKGWVNNEWQAYVNSDENIKVKNGNLILKAKKTKDANGNDVYTSGRVNTQNKQDYTYGLFEVKAKVPEGQGFLPAFWMMPTDENVYGQWPKCGEIDIMEVMGQENDKLYGTIHYGEPHKESQNTYTLKKGDFTDDYHTFSCEWEPGVIKWYVDGVLYHEESDWYSKVPGKGTVSYPAPFDQPFYMILNLAVGGSWVGNPDATTSFENAEFVIDSVRAYQKASYDDSNVKKPVKNVVLRDPDANGNYINNGNFAKAESLTDDTNWKFMTANNGAATAKVENNAIKIKTTAQGDVDYSVQLVQANVPFEKGSTYEVKFDAKASAARNMNVDIKAPDNGYAKYMNTLVADLTTTKKTFTTSFKMTEDSDANGRLEFNMGANGVADIEISNVSIKKTKAYNPNEVEEKTVLSNGNYIYNGEFQEGEGRVGFWEMDNTKNAKVSVTNLADGRRLKVENPAGSRPEDLVMKQTGLALQSGAEYALSFGVESDRARTMKVRVAGQEYSFDLVQGKNNCSKVVRLPAERTRAVTGKDVEFFLGGEGTLILDNIRLEENAMIKNGKFDAGFSGFDVYVNDAASATYVVDSLNEKNAADFTINKTGDQEWYIQLKQSGVTLTKDQWYTFSFDVKSSVARKIQYSIQRDGSVHKNADGSEDWTPYVQGSPELTAYEDNGEYTHVTKTFQMKEATDEGSIFNIALGGGSITEKHRVCIDNIVLKEATDEEIEASKPAHEGNNLLDALVDGTIGNSSWTQTIANWGDPKIAEATQYFDASGAVVYDITNPGTEDWNVQLKHTGISLEQGATYRVTYNIKSTVARAIKSGVMSTSYNWYGGSDPVLAANTETPISFEFTMGVDDGAADLYISMGKIAGVDTPASTITISNIKLERIN